MIGTNQKKIFTKNYMKVKIIESIFLCGSLSSGISSRKRLDISEIVVKSWLKIMCYV